MAIFTFPCPADHEQDWQPNPVDPYPCYCTCDDHTYIRTVDIISAVVDAVYIFGRRIVRGFGFLRLRYIIGYHYNMVVVFCKMLQDNTKHVRV